jgi:hypothetical protein
VLQHSLTQSVSQNDSAVTHNEFDTRYGLLNRYVAAYQHSGSQHARPAAAGRADSRRSSSHVALARRASSGKADQ